MTGPPQAHHVAAGDGERLVFNGTERHLKMTGAESTGQLTVYESSYPERTAHPLHIHHDAIESFYILEGTCRFRVGDDFITASQGSFLSIPRGATHGFVTIGGPARRSCSSPHRRWRAIGRKWPPRWTRARSTRLGSTSSYGNITSRSSDRGPMGDLMRAYIERRWIDRDCTPVSTGTVPQVACDERPVGRRIVSSSGPSSRPSTVRSASSGSKYQAIDD